MTSRRPPWRPLFTAALTLLAVAPAWAQEESGSPGCNGPEHRQFDFWLGSWDVYNPEGSQVGTNHLTSIYAGCAIREEWQSSGAHAGTSLNFYDPGTGAWYQTWVDNGGRPLRLSGGRNDRGEMVLSSGEGSKPLHRITWSPLEDGAVRQLWQISTDGGATWEVAFDGRYVRKQAE